MSLLRTTSWLAEHLDDPSVAERAGMTPDKMVTTYCHGGVRAAFGVFVLRLLGYPRVRAYDGSWAEYGDALEMPVGRVSEQGAGG
ncbi:MAG: rhodanese-like domain-containing protein [Dehalococcoidia bacterium]|jgi:thiosulfate/3-mercaptopyruvate sulfurtransferase|nr:rhodanese-like domain-containing protein [Dehalococcoidia bacterium]